MKEVRSKDVEEDGELRRVSSCEVEYEPKLEAVDQVSISGSGTQSEDWVFQRRLFLNFEVLNPKQHKVCPVWMLCDSLYPRCNRKSCVGLSILLSQVFALKWWT